MQASRQPDNQTTINVWKTLPSKARVTRDKVSGLQPTSKATVWKTVPIPSDWVCNYNQTTRQPNRHSPVLRKTSPLAMIISLSAWKERYSYASGWELTERVGQGLPASCRLIAMRSCVTDTKALCQHSIGTKSIGATSAMKASRQPLSATSYESLIACCSAHSPKP